MDEQHIEEIKAREAEVFAALWDLLGDAGLVLMQEALMPLPTYNPARGYSSGYADNFEPSGQTPEHNDKEFYARRKTIERVSGVLKRIHQVGFPEVKQEKAKKEKPSFK